MATNPKGTKVTQIKKDETFPLDPIRDNKEVGSTMSSIVICFGNFCIPELFARAIRGDTHAQKRLQSPARARSAALYNVACHQDPEHTTLFPLFCSLFVERSVMPHILLPHCVYFLPLCIMASLCMWQIASAALSINQPTPPRRRSAATFSKTTLMRTTWQTEETKNITHQHHRPPDSATKRPP
eukprot:629261-Amphidinium_carterae.1